MKRLFTLIELLIVVAIIAILAGMLPPALGQAKKIVEKAVCSSNQKQILAMHSPYSNEYVAARRNKDYSDTTDPEKCAKNMFGDYYH